MFDNYLVDEVFLIYAFTLPLNQQAKVLNERPIKTLKEPWKFFAAHPDPILFGASLRLFQNELSLRHQTYPDNDNLLALINAYPFFEHPSIEDLMMLATESSQFKSPSTIGSLLKDHGLPSKVPVLERVFRLTSKLYLALQIHSGQKADSAETPDLSEFSPVWGKLIIPRLVPEWCKSYETHLPEDVLKQAHLYLDVSKPFLLFKFHPDHVRPDQILAFGELSFVQKWAKKLASRILASSMFILGIGEDDAELLLPPQSPAVLDVKDAARTTSFQLYEPISSSFSDYVAFQTGIRRSLQLYAHKGVKKVEPFWVFKQLPSNGEFRAEHAGLIFGLGLMGGLKAFKSADAYELLSAGNEELSSAVLLGMAVSNMGTGHEVKFLPQMIGIHVPGYLPYIEGTSPQLAQVPLSTQISALLSLGLLFKGTGDRRVTSILFKEFSKRGMVSVKSRIHYTPAYTLAAGFALGLVCQNSDPKLEDSRVDTFIEALHGNDDFKVPSAFFALLATRDDYVASKIAIPFEGNKNHIKPIHLFLRLLLKTLLLRAFPLDLNDCIRSLKNSLERIADTFELDTHIAYLCHIVAAYAFFLGLYCSGTADSKAMDQLQAIYSLISKRCTENSLHMTFAEKYRHKNVAFLKDILLLSMALTMAGTGHKETFSLLRSHFMSLLDDCPTRAYLHHLALGFLLLGDVACLVASLLAGFNYPFMEDNYFAASHMQWLWILAVVPNSGFSKDITDEVQPEDLFLSDCPPSKRDYYMAASGNAEIYRNLNPEQTALLQSFYHLISLKEGQSSFIYDLCSVNN